MLLNKAGKKVEKLTLKPSFSQDWHIESGILKVHCAPENLSVVLFSKFPSSLKKVSLIDKS